MIRLPLRHAERLLRLLRVRPHFLAVELREAPYTDQMDPSLVYIERSMGLKFGALLCPGCGERLGLPLQIIEPRWQCRLDFLARPTISPSIRDEYGCGSEFGIRRGSVHWIYRTASEDL